MVLNKYVKSNSGLYTEAGTLVWGDLILQASEFADSRRPHRNPLGTDPSINAIIDYIQHTTTGHHHDGTDSRRFGPTISGPELVFQTGPGGAGSTPAVEFDDSNSGIVTYAGLSTVTALRAEDVGGGAFTDLVPALPGIILGAPTSFFLFPYLLSVFITDTNKLYNMAMFDVNNFAGGGTNILYLGDDGSGVLGTNGAISGIKCLCAAGSPFDVSQFTGGALLPKIIQLAGTPTVAFGVPGIVARGRLTGQTAAIASLATFTVGSSDGTFRVQGNVNVTSFTLGSFNMTVAYTDETNTARTLTLNFSTLTGTLGVAIGAAGPFEGIPTILRCKASTTITIATSGTFTNLTYNAEGIVEELV